VLISSETLAGYLILLAKTVFLLILVHLSFLGQLVSIILQIIT